MPFLDEIASLIESSGLDAPPPAGGLLVNQMLEVLEGDGGTALFETGPAGEGVRVHSQPGQRYVDQGGQAIVRARGELAARERAYEVWRGVFNGDVQNRRVQGTHYLMMEAVGVPYLFDRDAQDRYLYAFNFHAIKEPS